MSLYKKKHTVKWRKTDFTFKISPRNSTVSWQGDKGQKTLRFKKSDFFTLVGTPLIRNGVPDTQKIFFQLEHKKSKEKEYLLAATREEFQELASKFYNAAILDLKEKLAAESWTDGNASKMAEDRRALELLIKLQNQNAGLQQKFS